MLVTVYVSFSYVTVDGMDNLPLIKWSQFVIVTLVLSEFIEYSMPSILNLNADKLLNMLKHNNKQNKRSLVFISLIFYKNTCVV